MCLMHSMSLPLEVKVVKIDTTAPDIFMAHSITISSHRSSCFSSCLTNPWYCCAECCEMIFVLLPPSSCLFDVCVLLSLIIDLSTVLIWMSSVVILLVFLSLSTVSIFVLSLNACLLSTFSTVSMFTYPSPREIYAHHHDVLQLCNRLLSTNVWTLATRHTDEY